MLPQTQPDDTTPCGIDLIRLCDEHKAFRLLLAQFHLDQIPHDFFLEWHEALTPLDKRAVWAEYRREIRLALAVVIGVHGSLAVGLHGLFLLVIANPLTSGAVIASLMASLILSKFLH